MPPRNPTSDSDSSDGEAPETFSFGSSKQAAKGQAEAVRQFQAAEKLKQKEKNRAIDRKLKARAAESKEKGKTKSTGASHWEKATNGKGIAQTGLEDEEASGREDDEFGRTELEERMARAMREAAEEESDFDELSESGELPEDAAMEEVDGEAGELSDEEPHGNNDEDEDELEVGEEDEEDEDEEMASESEEDEHEDEEVESSPPSVPNKKRNYLPDHLFKSALSNSARQSTKITFGDEVVGSSRAPVSPPPKRRHAKRPAKEIVIGSRTIRTLQKSTEAISPAAAKGLPPPRRVKKFLKDSLNLKGDPKRSKTKGWSRQAANLGVMRRNGPAANFVRSS
ncbi:hypothetical protein C8Q79DRAFT_913814 [Trametes meyenii]|nr:hypothetical protein C8Q79DRAFT_913814 [Trametes meyenii]